MQLVFRKIIILSYAFVTLFLLFILINLREGLKSKYFDESESEVKNILYNGLAKLKTPSDVFFEQFIRQDTIQEMVVDICNAHEPNKKMLTELKGLLYPKFQKMASYGLSSITIKCKAGYDTYIFETEKNANQVLYHSVYPINDQNREVGFVEIGLRIDTLLNSLIHDHQYYYTQFLILNDQPMDQPNGMLAIEGSKGLFMHSEKYFNHNKIVDQYEENELLKVFLNEIGAIDQELSFTRLIRLDGQSYIAHLIPVENINADGSACFAFYQKEPNFLIFEIFLLILILGLNTLIFGAIIYYRNTNKKIKKKEEQLTIANDTKDRMFSIIGHDLVSPFNQIIGFMDILEMDLDNEDKEELRRNISSLKNNAKTTRDMIHNLLAWSRLQSNTIIYNPVQVPIRQLVRDITCQYNFSINEKKISVQLDIDDDLKVFADTEMLKTIIRNLFFNAIKFSPFMGKIMVRDKSEANNFVLCIEDEGTGMDQETATAIEQGLNKISKPGTAKEKGTGLGLQLCYDFVKYHGGNLRVRKNTPRGTSICVILPKN